MTGSESMLTSMQIPSTEKKGQLRASFLPPTAEAPNPRLVQNQGAEAADEHERMQLAWDPSLAPPPPVCKTGKVGDCQPTEEFLSHTPQGVLTAFPLSEYNMIVLYTI